MELYNEMKEVASKWNAKFMFMECSVMNRYTRGVLAKKINAPHEDDHLRTPMTANLIEEMQYRAINISVIKELHSYLFSGDLAAHGVAAGQWRTHNVRVGNYTPPDACGGYIIDDLMNCLLKDTLTPVEFYKVFQCIHPFSDGNGRVGGILLATMSFTNSTVMYPCQ
jgi:Fic family protein